MRIGIDFRMVKSFPTGVSTYVVEITRALLELDKTNNYFLIYQDQVVLDKYVEVFEDYSNLSFIKVKYKSNHPLQYIFLPFELKKHKFDYLITDMWGAVLFTPCRYILTIHDLLFFHYPQMATLKVKLHNTFLMKRLVKKSYRILTVSDYSKNDIVKYLNADKEKIIVSYEGVSSSYFKKYDEKSIEKCKIKYNIKDDYFIYVGNIKPHKNLFMLLDAFEVFMDNLSNENRNISLVLVGDFDTETRKDNTPELLNKINNHKYNHNIIRVGHINNEDMGTLLSGAIALVHPSLFEGFGLTVLEAMNSGTAVLCSNTSSLPEVAGEAALCFDPNSKTQIAEKMNKIYSDSNLRSELIQKAKERAIEFNWERSAKVLLSVIN